MCCTWLAHDCPRATWTYVLEIVCGAARRLSEFQTAPLNVIIIIIIIIIVTKMKAWNLSGLSQPTAWFWRCLLWLIMWTIFRWLSSVTNLCNVFVLKHSNAVLNVYTQKQKQQKQTMDYSQINASCLSYLSCTFIPRRTWYVACDKPSMCCTWFAHNHAWTIWVHMLETVSSAVRRLWNI